ncbi:hypothetical protein DFP73DRAFT_591988 [Morchella snyderi]|nr:hypothetical protein DFP73DRAFT_591988 [Morchella snyderi]
MPVRSYHRWEEIAEFIPRGGSGPTFQHANFMTNDSANASSALLLHPAKKSQFKFDPTKYFELPRPEYKSPVIVYSTPLDAPPPRSRLRPLVQSIQSDHVPRNDLPPTIRSEVQDAVPPSIVIGVHATNTADAHSSPAEKGISLSNVMETQIFEVSDEGKTSQALTEESMLKTFEEKIDNNLQPERVHIETRTDSNRAAPDHHFLEPAQESKPPVALECDIPESQSAVVVNTTSEPPSFTHVSQGTVGDEIKDLLSPKKNKEQNDKSIGASLGAAGAIQTPREITSTSQFNWADDAIDEEESQLLNQPFMWREKVLRYTTNTASKGDLPDKKGPRIAEVITPAHGYFTGGPTALVLTTVGIGADIFTSWDTTVLRTTRNKLPVILEEPVSGRKDFFTDYKRRFEHEPIVAGVKETIPKSEKDEVEKVEQMALDQAVISPEAIATEPVVELGRLPETVISDIHLVIENTAILNHMPIEEKAHRNCEVSKTAVVHHESSLELSFFLLLILVSLGLLQIMP